MSEHPHYSTGGIGTISSGQQERHAENRGVPAVQVEHLRKAYGRLVAVNDVSFVTQRGEAFGFLGPNGAGKSTVVKILTGLITSTEGTARVLGHPVSHLETRRKIGYLPELPNFHRWLRAQEFLQYHGQLLKIGPPATLFDEPLVLEVRVDAVSEDLLRRVGAVSLAVQRDEANPLRLLVEVQDDEQAADVAAAVHASGTRLFSLQPR